MNRNFLLLAAASLVFTRISAQQVNLRQVSKENLLMHSRPIVVNLNGALYSTDNTNAIYKTTLDSGVHTQVGKATYRNTRFFFGINNRLFSIENDGSMNMIDPSTGNWTVGASMGAWDNISMVIVVGNSFYSIENGAFYAHQAINAKARRQVGGTEFFNVGRLLPGDTSLYSLMRDGNLYRIDLRTGEWTKVGKGKDWKYATAGAVVGNKLYTLENKGALYETMLADGTRRQLETTQFETGGLLFANAGKLYGINKDGTLYEISVL